MSALRRVRIDARMSIEELAEASKVSADTIAAIETGKSRNPRTATLVQLADALEVAPSEIDPVLTTSATEAAA